MSIIQMTPCIVSDQWSGFVEWAAETFDLPVACRFEDEGWARLLTQSPGITVIHAKHFENSHHDQKTIVELEVRNIRQVMDRAVDAGAEIITPVKEVTNDGFHSAIKSPQGIILWLWQSPETQTEIDSAVHQGPIHFTVNRQIKALPGRVFDAITKTEHLSSFFVSKASDDFGPGRTITWEWGQKGDELTTLEFRPNQYVAFRWKAANCSYNTRTQFNVRANDTGTDISITECGWDSDPTGLRSSFAHCEGWTQFLANLKMYLEHGIAVMNE